MTVRHGLLCAMAATGAAIALATEALGAAGAMNRVSVAAFWCAVAAAAAAAAWRNRRRIAWRSFSIFDALLATGVAAVGAVTFAVALVSPPNSVDAFGYHLSRVVWWVQAGGVGFFPTHYFNQLSMPPFAEYAMLHAWLLAAGDRLVNLVQWTGFAGSALAASLAAGALGAGRRGQVLAAVFCATLPNAILQASGAKNDCVLALWLAASSYFTLRWSAQPNHRDAWWASLCFGLALLTKGTAYLFAPAILLGAVTPHAWRNRAKLIRLAMALAICAFALNGLHWARNLDLSGSPLGFPSAQPDGKYTWRNGRIGLGVTLSNALRHASQQLAGRSESWNCAVYEAVVGVHRALGIDPDDSATTWPGERFAPPVNSNHEADAPNRLHLALLALAVFALALWTGVDARPTKQVGQASRPVLSLSAGITLAFLLTCAAFRYQPWFGRVFLPLFVAAAPVFGLIAERLRPAALQAVLGVLLFDGSRHALFENWTRPLKGPASILRTSREDNYFRDMAQFGVTASDYRRATSLAASGGCREIGIDNERFQLEYPLQALLLARDSRIRFVHTGVRNASAKYAHGPAGPCAVVCLGCAGDAAKMAGYAGWPAPEQAGPFLVYRRGGLSSAVTTAPAAAISASFQYTSLYPDARSLASRARSMIEAK